MHKPSLQLSTDSPGPEAEPVNLEDIRGQLHLLEGGINSLKEGQRETSTYLGTIMRHLVEIRSDASYARALGEYMAPKLAPLLRDPSLLVGLEELHRAHEAKLVESVAATPTVKRASFSELTDTGKHDAITESQLKLTMTLERNRELEKQIADGAESRRYWGRWIIGLAGLLVVGVVTAVAVTRLTRPAASMTVETKESPHVK